jgi:cytochrome c-type biogenesis protein CcmH
MTGWLIFAGLALLILGLLWLIGRVGKAALMLIAAALFVAAAGYAWQGSPGLPGAPAAGQDRPFARDAIFATERLRFLNHYGETGIVLGTADAFHRTGMDQAAVGLLRNAILKHPQDVDLRIGYAHALLMLAQGNLTPAVDLAFDNAAEVAKPDDPRPAYFRGLAHIEASDLTGGERVWRALYAGLPKGSPWAAALAERLAPFDMMRAAAAQRAAATPTAPIP